MKATIKRSRNLSAKIRITVGALLTAGALSVAPQSHADFSDELSSIAGYLSDISGLQQEMYDLQAEQGIPDLNDIRSLNNDIKSLTDTDLLLNQEQWSAMRQAYNMKRQLTNAVPAELWSSADWDEALKATSGGNSSRYNQLKSDYAAKNPIITTSNQTIDVGELTEKTYTQKSDIANTALASSQYTYEDVDNRIQSFDELKEWLDDPNVNQNQKAAIDLNTRVLIEIGYIQTEMLRLQSVQAQVAAMKAQEEVNSITSEKSFFSND